MFTCSHFLLGSVIQTNKQGQVRRKFGVVCGRILWFQASLFSSRFRTGLGRPINVLKINQDIQELFIESKHEDFHQSFSMSWYWGQGAYWIFPLYKMFPFNLSCFNLKWSWLVLLYFSSFIGGLLNHRY